MSVDMAKMAKMAIATSASNMQRVLAATVVAACVTFSVLPGVAHAQAPAAVVAAPAATSTLPPEMVTAIDRAVEEVLIKTGAPSASIAIVQDGRLALARAYGQARLAPPLAAAPTMRYSIGSISKQFTASAILLLAQERKLTLDDKVSKWFPGLTRASDITIRHLLSMTSGYSDFWPQDYVMPPMRQDITAEQIMNDWAKKPLDFAPGSQWQYSNTNYVIAGAIVEKVAGKPLLTFLREKVFGPLQMTSVSDTDQAPLGDGEPMRHRLFGAAPARPAPKEGKGWMFAAGELAMTASDLARWDISLITRSVLKPESYRLLETEVLLNNGAPTGYALGMNVGFVNGRRRLSHSGEVSGFTAGNDVYPDDGVAIAVQVNLDASAAYGQITSRIANLLFTAKTAAETQTATEQARRVYDDLRQGRIDRTRFTENCNDYFSSEALRDIETSLGPLGAPDSFTAGSPSLRGGLVFRGFTITYSGTSSGKRTLRLSTFVTPDGKYEQYLIAPVD